jgi:hypothetical protein
MPLNDQVLNAFATSLADCVRERAKGCDDKSARIVNARPNEFVLAGFLTPRSVGDHTPRDDEDEAATDLPQDSAYEQTAIGLEWMVDAREFSKIDTFEVEVSAHVCGCFPRLRNKRTSARGTSNGLRRTVRRVRDFRQPFPYGFE